MVDVCQASRCRPHRSASQIKKEKKTEREKGKKKKNTNERVHVCEFQASSQTRLVPFSSCIAVSMLNQARRRFCRFEQRLIHVSVSFKNQPHWRREKRRTKIETLSCVIRARAHREKTRISTSNDNSSGSRSIDQRVGLASRVTSGSVSRITRSKTPVYRYIIQFISRSHASAKVRRVVACCAPNRSIYERGPTRMN